MVLLYILYKIWWLSGGPVIIASLIGLFGCGGPGLEMLAQNNLL